MGCKTCGSIAYNHQSFGNAMLILRPVVYGGVTYMFSRLPPSGPLKPFQITARTGACCAALTMGLIHGIQDKVSHSFAEKKVTKWERLSFVLIGSFGGALLSGRLTALLSRQPLTFRPFLEGAFATATSPLAFWGVGKGIEIACILWPHENDRLSSREANHTNGLFGDYIKCPSCKFQWDSVKGATNKRHLAKILSACVAAYGLSHFADRVIKRYRLPVPQNLPLKVWVAGTLASSPPIFSFGQKRALYRPLQEGGKTALSTFFIYLATKNLNLNLSTKELVFLGGISYIETMLTYCVFDTLICQAYQLWPRLDANRSGR